MTVFSTGIAPTPAHNEVGGTASKESFDPTQGLVGILWRAIAHNEDVLVTREGSEGIVLIPSLRQYIQYSSNLKSFCGGDPDGYEVKCLDAGYRAQFERGTRLARCMYDLLWQAGFYASGGRLISGCGLYDVVTLTRWPNLTRVESTPSSMAIAALLRSYPTNINLARSLTGVDAAEMNTFCSAAFASKSLRILSRPEAVTEPVLKPHRQRSILGKILNRLRS